MTAFQYDSVPGEFQLLGEKTDQRRVGFSFNRRCAQFDLDRAAVSATGRTRCGELACDTVDLGIRNDANAENCHGADRNRTNVNLLDGFWRRMASSPFMKTRHVYLIFAVLGFVIPYSQFVPWLLEHGLNLNLLFRELFANRISAFFAMDVIVSAMVLIWFIQSEGKRLRMGLFWLPTIGTLIVGVSFGFPLFLFLRQVTLDRATARA